MSTAKQNVIVVGAFGRVGRFAVELLDADAGFNVVARVGSGDDLAQTAGQYPEAVALDVTRAGLGAKHATTLLRAGVPTVIGTSGVTPEEVQQLDALARQQLTGVWVLPNFSRGAALLSELAQRAAAVWQEIHIEETHRIEKVDAPSGTALRLAQELAAVTGRAPEIESQRLRGADATHVVTFVGDGETLQITHAAEGLSAYRGGILAGLRSVRLIEGARYGWQSSLGLPSEPSNSHNSASLSPPAGSERPKPEWRNR